MIRKVRVKEKKEKEKEKYKEQKPILLEGPFQDYTLSEFGIQILDKELAIRLNFISSFLQIF